MNPAFRIVAIGGLAIVVFDALASLASLNFGFEYMRAAIGSSLLYVIIGYFAARVGGWKLAASAGAAVGLIDATLGWLVSALIGPGSPAVPLTAAVWVGTAVFVMIAAAVIALIGAAILAIRRKFRRSVA